MNYRRSRAKGAAFFFTVVTEHRRRVFSSFENIRLIGLALDHVKEKHPFEMDAFVILPDHIHCIWTMPEGIDDFSTRWRLVKSYFTKRCRTNGKIWQDRFWEHQIRDEDDFTRHVEYIHYNPVKHGYAKSPIEWVHSSFREAVEKGIYQPDWGAGQCIQFDSMVGSE